MAPVVSRLGEHTNAECGFLQQGVLKGLRHRFRPRCEELLRVFADLAPGTEPETSHIHQSTHIRNIKRP